MTFDPDIHRRRSMRLRGYDYTAGGAYFVTICTHNRECLFGEVVNGNMLLNELGKTVPECWEAIPAHFPNAFVDTLVVMPNHVHGIIGIVGATHASPLPRNASPACGPEPQSLGAIIGSFKSATTKRINTLRDTPGVPVWQRNYHEHIIRHERTLDAIRRYIHGNPKMWLHDSENPQTLVEARHAVPLPAETRSAMAKHYGFTDEEMDFIINYDIKYRMGQDNDEGREE